MKIKEYNIQQSPSEPPRRQFSDNQHFDLVIWYQNPKFEKIIGFQLGYKENPFNTDEEYFLTHLPSMENTSEIALSKTSGSAPQYPAPKLIHSTNEILPPSFFDRIKGVLGDLPDEARAYLEVHLEGLDRELQIHSKQEFGRR